MSKYKNRTGEVYGNLQVLEFAGRNKHKQILWKCKCLLCSNEVVVVGGSLVTGHTTSCGCYGSNIKRLHLTGETFGRLTVLGRAGKSKDKHSLWRCRCSCGNEVIVWGSALTCGKTVSCGCVQKEVVTERMTGDTNPNWKGGVAPLNLSIRGCAKYKDWIKQVFERDKFTCNICTKVGGDLEAHHIKRFSDILSESHITLMIEAIECVELWDTSNEVTLCKHCHTAIHNKSELLDDSNITLPI